MRRITIISCIAVFLCVSLAFAQQGQNSTTDNLEKSQQDYKQMQEKSQQEFRLMQEEMRKREAQDLEKLKQTDPQLYQERKAAIERQNSLQAVISDFQQGKLTSEQAESQLFPLVKADMRPEQVGLDKQIAMLEQQLDFLKKAKQDPDLLVRRRVAMMLGKEQPGIEGPLGFGY